MGRRWPRAPRTMQCGCSAEKVRCGGVRALLLFVPAAHECCCCDFACPCKQWHTAPRTYPAPSRHARPSHPGLPCHAGVLRSLLSGHRGMVMAVRWNKRGDLLLSGAQRAACACAWASLACTALPAGRCTDPVERRSCWQAAATGPPLSAATRLFPGYFAAGSLDGSLIVWDAKAGQQSKQYSHHGAPIVDADWRNNTMFASCSQARSAGMRCLLALLPSAGAHAGCSPIFVCCS